MEGLTMADELPRPASFAEFLERVRCLCALYHASMTSCARTDTRNARVGGNAASKHRLAMGAWAADLVCDAPELTGILADSARALGLVVEIESDHVHVQGIPAGPIPAPGPEPEP